MNAPIRLSARVVGQVPKAKVKHYQGLPPQFTGGNDTRVEMESPALILIEQTPEGVFLFRYMTDGRVVGDTWHKTIDDAKEQARYEYGDSITTWKLVPADTADVVAFGLEG